MWIDTHCHLDAADFDADRDAVVARARAAGVLQIVLPAVDRANFERVRTLAHEHGLAYALGIHPMCTDRAGDDDVAALRDALARAADDPRLVAIGVELGGVEVAMRVDPHAGMMPAGAAVTGHGRRATVLTRACGQTGAQLARHPGTALAAPGCSR